MAMKYEREKLELAHKRTNMVYMQNVQCLYVVIGTRKQANKYSLHAECLYVVISEFTAWRLTEFKMSYQHA
jgi:hypothetical protein